MSTKRRRRSAVGAAFDWASWPVLILLWGAALAWTGSGWSWRLDLTANLAAQAALATLAFALLWLATRRWALLAGAALALAVHMGVLGLGRAAWWGREPLSGFPAERPAGAVRVLHYNASSRGAEEPIRELMRESGADLLSILAPPVRMQANVMYSPGLRGEYAGQLNRYFVHDPESRYAKISAGFIVSRWPLTPYDLSWAGEMAEHLIAGVVERPDELVPGTGEGRGRFGVLAVHPRSPRNARRWAEGNAVTEMVGLVAERMRAEGLPVVVITDLNSTPSGWRSRRLARAADLRRAKPLLTPAGTYPRVLAFTLQGRRRRIPGRWPLSVAIDDVLVTPGARVLGWRAGPAIGEEHLPITVDLAVPAGSAGAPADQADEPG